MQTRAREVLSGDVDAAVPRFFLYGDEEYDPDRDFLHSEMIATRSGPNNWIIAPHTHPAHAQLLYVTEGGGRIHIEGHDFALPPPCLVVVPCGLVHDIAWHAGTDGVVVNVAATYLAILTERDARLMEGMTRPAVFALEADNVQERQLRSAFLILQREFIGNAPGRRTALMAHLLQVLVDLLRLHRIDQSAATLVRHRDHDILLRYRELLETHFRRQKRLGFYAHALGVTPARLNNACRNVAGASAARLLHERLVVEAKRYLLFAHVSVAEVSHALGFSDPAYFNRFFVKRVGTPPGAFRAGAAGRATRSPGAAVSVKRTEGVSSAQR